MAQTYVPQQPVAQAGSDSVQDRIENGENIEDVQQAYVQLQTRLVGAVDATKDILSSIKDFNKSSWIVRYPTLAESSSPSSDSTKNAPAVGRGMRRALSFADDPSSSREVVIRPGMHRSMTLAAVSENEEAQHDHQPQFGDALTEEPDPTLLPPSSNFNLLKLDLKLGPTGTTPAFLINQLEKTSIANLIEERIDSTLNHMDNLKARAEDTSSKILVTGDLNAGKSTFVNALLRREVMPVDQQPCTAMFCEVHDAADNDGKEEVHLVKDGVRYERTDDSTFIRASLSDLESLVVEPENAQRVLKLYVNDARNPSESLLHNGIADIALIDAPGLNRDSLKTTAVFARQEEIDVVVFVVSAENHFTLSAKEFLWNASNEKAYIFIVVNRFDQIRDKARCKRLVLDQIKQLSPRTYEDAEDLVHFVDSSSALHSTSVNGAFDKLESDLRSFVLVKRSKSKLQPVVTYLDNVLADVSLLASSNAILAESERDLARAALEVARPILEKMKASREGLEDGLENVEDDGATKARTRTRDRLNNALDRVGTGNLAEEGAISMPEYPGLLGVLEYTRDVKKALLASLDLSVKLAEDEARLITSAGVAKIQDMEEVYLPEGVERSRRVFMPSAMFSLRAAKKAKRNSGTLVVGGIHGLGIGLAQRPEMLDVSFLDIMDLQHRLSTHLKGSDESKSGLDSNDAAAGALSLASLGVGALTLASGKAVGLRGAFEGLVRITDLFGNETARKWAAPVLGAFTIGLTVYFVLELPSTIPKNVGRRIKASLIRGEEGQEEELKFVNAHATRISRETRKVLRLASWDLRERFRGAMEERQQEVKANEEQERRAIKAFEFFEAMTGKAADVSELVHS
ncbi:Transmembrane GTPase fzo1 [Serendipita indica DSM 11827]|uniref:Related to GTP-binding protein FZO1, required for biogenesis of mitochondria n=1 Tax=Serendipita indica (strain DSM 11827) TaxID=1109443 RepID=G4TM26_SERID|nr:Transmembrane GTPase fzo1 [Serendipita indica DSM 11827]CCA72369.1 related to GTP-binding protein FZO1, required for biogenesis of mitochondria [Serendipita indica DSM 11827]